MVGFDPEYMSVSSHKSKTQMIAMKELTLVCILDQSLTEKSCLIFSCRAT